MVLIASQPYTAVVSPKAATGVVVFAEVNRKVLVSYVFGSARRRLAAPLALVVVLMAAPAAHAELSAMPDSPIGTHGTGAGQFDAPGGVAVNESTGDVYVADTDNNRIQRFAADGTFISAIGWGVDDGLPALEVCTSGCQAGLAGDGDGQMDQPTGIGINQTTGDVYVGSQGSGTIAQLTGAGAFVRTFPGTPYDGNTLVAGVDVLEVAPDGDVYVTAPGQTLRFDASGTPLTDFPAQTSRPIVVAFDGNGDMLLSDDNGAASGLYRFDAFGTGLGRLFQSAPPRIVAADAPHAVLLVGWSSFGKTRFQTVDRDGADRVSSFGEGLVADASGSAYNPSASLPGTHGGAYYVVDRARDRLAIMASRPMAPEVAASSARDVGLTGATLRGLVDPGFDTATVSVEYGTTTSYGFTAAAGTVSGDGFEHRADAELDELAPDTTYHYRVVARNAEGTTHGPDRTFRTDTGDTALRLPDGRGWEQVSPVQKNGNAVQNPESTGGAPAATFATASGSAIAYAVVGAFPGADASTRFNVPVSSRTADAWLTRVIDPRAEVTPAVNSGDVHAVSPDLSHAVVSSVLALTPDAVPGVGHYYLRDTATGAYTLLGSNPDITMGVSAAPVLGGAPDYSRMYLVETHALTADATEGVTQIYSWTAADGLRLIPGAQVASSGDSGSVVSSDGRRLVYQDGGELRLRDADGSSVSVSKGHSASFARMSDDASEIYFSSTASVTPEAQANRAELYRFDAADGHVDTITAGVDVEAPGFRQQLVQVQAVSADGDTSVFTLRGTESPTSSASTPIEQYVYRHGVVHHVRADDANHVWISPNGKYLLALTSEALTPDSDTGGHDQVYRYDTDTRTFTCVSCRASGAASQAASSLSDGILPPFAPPYATRNVLDNGRVVFQSKDALVPGDVNGRQDVYLWQNGHPYLLSDGRTDSDASFADASATGDDVFFTTRARLVTQDRDEYVDMYDARVGGGLAGQNPPPAPPECVGDTCQGPVPAPPVIPLAGSVTFAGPGDLPDAPDTPKAAARKVTATKPKTVKGTTARLAVRVPGAGRVSLSGAGIKATKKSVGKAQTVNVTVTLSAKAKATLRKKHRLVVSARVGYVPKSGAASSVTVRITFTQPAAKSKGGK